jgi:hypothetical protein
LYFSTKKAGNIAAILHIDALFDRLGNVLDEKSRRIVSHRKGPPKTVVIIDGLKYPNKVPLGGGGNEERGVTLLVMNGSFELFQEQRGGHGGLRKRATVRSTIAVHAGDKSIGGGASVM